MLKTTRLSNLASKTFRVDNNKVVKDGKKANKTVINLFKNNKSWNLIYVPNIKFTKKHISLISNAKKSFNYLK